MHTVPKLACGMLVLLAACQKPPETAQQAADRMQQEAATVRSALQTTVTRWQQWVAAGLVDSLPTIFVDQGYELPPNAPPAHGADGIKAYHAQSFALGPQTVQLSVDDVMANGPLAVARGAYEFSLQPGPTAPPGMTAVADTGKWMGALKQVDGQWRFTALIWNSNLALPQPAAAPAPRRR